MHARDTPDETSPVTAIVDGLPTAVGDETRNILHAHVSASRSHERAAIIRSESIEGDVMTRLLPPRLQLNHTNDNSWHSDVRNLLDFLPVLYPGGEQWLDARLRLIDEGGAVAHLVRDSAGALIGVLLGIAKESRRFKVSTLYVAPGHRGTGIGRTLIDSALLHARQAECEEIYITGATTVRDELSPLLSSRGFVRVATEKDRYGVGRDEDVYSRAV